MSVQSATSNIAVKLGYKKVPLGFQSKLITNHMAYPDDYNAYAKPSLLRFNHKVSKGKKDGRAEFSKRIVLLSQSNT